MFPRGLPHYGPQDIEAGVQESPPGEYIERLLCALLGLVLNRKKDVEYGRHPIPDTCGVHADALLPPPIAQPSTNTISEINRRAHFTRPLEEAIHTHQSQWPKAWGGKNPLHGGRSFATMTPEERVRSKIHHSSQLPILICLILDPIIEGLDTLVTCIV